jgi:hypothetical protein
MTGMAGGLCRLSSKTFLAVDQASFDADFEPATSTTTDKPRAKRIDRGSVSLRLL